MHLGDNAFESLLDEPIAVAVPVSHPFAGRATVRLEELRGEPFILCREGYHLRSLTLEACGLVGFTPRVSVSGTDVDTALRFVRAAGRDAGARDRRPPVAGVAVPVVDRLPHHGIAWNPHRYFSPPAASPSLRKRCG